MKIHLGWLDNKVWCIHYETITGRYKYFRLLGYGNLPAYTEVACYITTRVIITQDL